MLYYSDNDSLNNQGDGKIKNIFNWLPVIITMIVIFILSSQQSDQSNELSGGILHIVLSFFKNIISIEIFDTEIVHFIIRKSAHFTAYFILGIFTLKAFIKSNVNVHKSIILTIIFCMLYAMTDEAHQLLVPGRSGQIKDVFIDTSGACFGVLVMYLIIFKVNLQ